MATRRGAPTWRRVETPVRTITTKAPTPWGGFAARRAQSAGTVPPTVAAEVSLPDPPRPVPPRTQARARAPERTIPQLRRGTWLAPLSSPRRVGACARRRDLVSSIPSSTIATRRTARTRLWLGSGTAQPRVSATDPESRPLGACRSCAASSTRSHARRMGLQQRTASEASANYTFTDRRARLAGRLRGWRPAAWSRSAGVPSPLWAQRALDRFRAILGGALVSRCRLILDLTCRSPSAGEGNC